MLIAPSLAHSLSTRLPHQLLTRQGEALDHFLNSVIAQAFVLSVWHDVHGFGMPDRSVSTGEMNRNVWAATKLSLMVCSICGIWQAVQSLPGLFAA